MTASTSLRRAVATIATGALVVLGGAVSVTPATAGALTVPGTVAPDLPVAGAPGAPTTLMASGLSGSVVNIGWAAPRDGGTGISAYAVRYRVVDSLSWVLAKPVEGRCATLAGLTAGTTYVVAVRTLASNYQMSPWATVTVSTVPAASRAVRPKMVPGQDAVVRVRNAHHRHGGSAATRAARR